MLTSAPAALRSLTFTPVAHPRLLCSAADIPLLRQRAADHSGMLARVTRRLAELMSGPGAQADVLQPYVASRDGVTVAQAYVLTGDEKLVPWVKDRVRALLAMDTWLSPVHGDVCRVCDHVMANVAADVVQMHDLLGGAWSLAETAGQVADLRRLHFDPFLQGTSDPVEFWFDPTYLQNWKIMVCGETGLAACGVAEHLEDAGEILARSVEGVLQVLDAVPPEGDWPEGVGYWAATLRFGLQFARALHCLTGGEVDLFTHPALRSTGDFLTSLTTPGGAVYNFSDCNPEFSPQLSEVLALLASATRRGDWMAVARAHPAETLPYLCYLDADVPDAPPPRAVAAFPTTGVATLRRQTTFVGLRSGPSEAGHSHLDANSFVLEAQGAPLVSDYPYWPQAHFLGYFDAGGPRWAFDALATIGHSTLLVDDGGQTYGAGCGGRIVQAVDHGTWARLVGEAGGAYPGLLTQFTRTILLLGTDVIVIRDLVTCDGERRIEWLLHYSGEVTTRGLDSIIESRGVRLAVTPFLPERAMGRRVSDVTRTSTYECSDTRLEVTRAIRYRSFSAFRPSAAAEFLFGLRVNGAGGADWTFTPSLTGWALRAEGYEGIIVPDGESLRYDRS